MQGMILLNKPKGLTSFSAVSRIKRFANEKRVGHTGTLDPMATGVLPILLGRATALSSLMLDADKKYIATIKLGITTDTDDITGNIITTNNVTVSDEEIDKTLNRFIGKIEQTPPIYSALKKDGVRLYQLARQGKSVEIPTRKIEIFSIKRLSQLDENKEFTIEVHVSKGTYIRSLARDIGKELFCGATLSSLSRIYASAVEISSCVTLEEIEKNGIENYLLNEENAVLHLPFISVTEKQAVRFCNGGQLSYDRLHLENVQQGELFRIKFKDKFLGIGFADNENRQIGIKCIINKPKGEF